MSLRDLYKEILPVAIEFLESNSFVDVSKGVHNFTVILRQDPPLITRAQCLFILPKLQTLLHIDTHDDLLIETCVCFSHLSSFASDQVYNSGTLIPLIQILFKTKNFNVIKYSLSAIFNIVGKSSDYRNDAIESVSLIEQLLYIFDNYDLDVEEDDNVDFIEQQSLMIFELYNDNPLVPLYRLLPFLNYFKQWLYIPNYEIVENTMKTITNITSIEEGVQCVVENNALIERIVQIINGRNDDDQEFINRILHPSISTIAHICKSKSSHIDVIVKLGILETILSLISHDDSTIRYVVYSTIVNLTSQCTNQILQTMIDLGYFTTLLNIFEQSTVTIKNEIIAIFFNLISLSSQLDYLINIGYLQSVTLFLQSFSKKKDFKLVLYSLEIILYRGSLPKENNSKDKVGSKRELDRIVNSLNPYIKLCKSLQIPKLLNQLFKNTNDKQIKSQIKSILEDFNNPNSFVKP
ncbi:hypothetical protein CYY_003150 [Polysphondylium violaceum]|uniref:Armadillo repeat-containing protein n=1 Tax=Polysphondylium violaceum TaxID=133409 RepID=A0A8J4Q0A9_9MYCE|nr:hypothetical protein CYY_003150 [Polysphondylium violaceum]